MSLDTHSTASLPPIPLLKKNFFDREHLFFQKNPNFVRFEKSYYFSRILRQICNNLVEKNSRSEHKHSQLSRLGVRITANRVAFEEHFLRTA